VVFLFVIGFFVHSQKKKYYWVLLVVVHKLIFGQQFVLPQASIKKIQKLCVGELIIFVQHVIPITTTKVNNAYPWQVLHKLLEIKTKNYINLRKNVKKLSEKKANKIPDGSNS